MPEIFPQISRVHSTPQQGAGPFFQAKKKKAKQVDLTTWNEEAIRVVQRALRAKGFYFGHTTGKLDPKTEAIFFELYGDTSWKSKIPDVVRQQVNTLHSAAKSKQHDLRYAEMFKDGYLTVTVGLGYDEAGQHHAQYQEVKNGVTKMGFNAFTLNAYTKKLMGITDVVGEFYWKKNALSYQPPLGTQRNVHVVIRIIKPESETNSAHAAAGFKEGMTSSDVTFYGGHARHGSGPDFDRNFKIEMLDGQGQWQEITAVGGHTDYEILKHYLDDKVKGGSRLQKVEHLIREGKLRVTGYNQGNIRLSDKNPKQGDFGADFLFWVLNRPGTGAQVQTGKTGPLNQSLGTAIASGYRVSVFDGCQTKNYFTGIRSSPNMGTQSMDVIGTKTVPNAFFMGGDFIVFLDSLIKQHSAETILKNLDARNQSAKFGSSGLDDNLRK